MRTASRSILRLLMALAVLGAPQLAWAEGGSTVGRVADRAEEVGPLAVGDRVPPVLLRDPKGRPVPLDSVLGSEHTALVFYRGGW